MVIVWLKDPGNYVNPTGKAAVDLVMLVPLSPRVSDRGTRINKIVFIKYIGYALLKYRRVYIKNRYLFAERRKPANNKLADHAIFIFPYLTGSPEMYRFNVKPV